ncbi:MAG: 2',3'-cyclic-nucleotide 2'-phosphodiesterase, partial [Alphaproteobacteria bacterium]
PDIDAAAGLICGKPVCMAGWGGSHLGVIDLDLRRDAGRWRPAGASVALRAADGAPGSAVGPLGARVAAIARPALHALRDSLRQPLGEIARPLHSHFALVANDPCTQLIADAQRAHVESALSGSSWAELPLVSAASAFRTGADAVDLPPGPLDRSALSRIYPYPNVIDALLVDGAGLADWLEMAAGLYETLTKGRRDQPLIRPGFPGFNFDVIAGLEYQIDLSRPARFDPYGQLVAPDSRRIVRLECEGRPVRPSDRFIVAASSYRSGGGGNYPGLSPERIVLAGTRPAQDILAEYIRKHGPHLPPPRPVWSFVPLPGTGAVFETGQGALAHLDAVTDRRLTALGPAGPGLTRMRLELAPADACQSDAPSL